MPKGVYPRKPKPEPAWYAEARRLKAEGVGLREMPAILGKSSGGIAYALYPHLREVHRLDNRQRYADLKAYGKRAPVDTTKPAVSQNGGEV